MAVDVARTGPGQVSVVDGVATVVVGDGSRRNAMDTAGWQALGAAAAALPGDLRAVVLRGHGATFCAGADLREWDGADDAAVDASFAAVEAALRAIEAVEVPTLAVVEGTATGGGCLLALACDVQLVAASTRIGMPVARLGILVSPAFATRLCLRVGPARAKEMLYTGRLLDAEQAERTGLVTTVVDDAVLDAELERLLARWRAQPASALRAAKAAVDTGLAPLTAVANAAPTGPASDRAEMTRRVRDFLSGGWARPS